jgi:hypothetical protein
MHVHLGYHTNTTVHCARDRYCWLGRDASRNSHFHSLSLRLARLTRLCGRCGRCGRYGRYGLESLNNPIASISEVQKGSMGESILLDGPEQRDEARRPCIVIPGSKVRTRLVPNPDCASASSDSSASELRDRMSVAFPFLSFIPVRAWLKHAIASRLTIEASLWYHRT